MPRVGWLCPRISAAVWIPAGFEKTLGEDGTPHFVPSGSSANPDERWDDEFFRNGCEGNGVTDTVFALAVSAGDLYVGGGIAAVNAMALMAAMMLFVGGPFRLAGDKPSNRIASCTTRGTLEVTLTGSGSVSSDPAGLYCPGTCSEKFSWD